MSFDKKTQTDINTFVTQIKRGKPKGRYEKGKYTLELLKIFISKFVSKSSKTTFEVLEFIRKFGQVCTKQLPTEMVIGNMTRRVLFFIRDEYARESARITKKLSRENLDELEVSHQPNLISLLEVEQSEDFSIQFKDIYENVKERMNELLEELEDVYKNITDTAIEHIHTNEVILTFGHSKSVESVLLGASKKRKFHVVVTENAPSYSGHFMAETLSKNGINTTLISNSSIFAVMSRVNKVIIGASSVMAKGGLIGQSGLHQLCLAANHFSVPVVVITGLHKLTPLYPIDQDTFNNMGNPKDIVPFEFGSNLRNVQFVAPESDYIPPHLITLFITNGGTYNSNSIYRLLSDYYSPLDYTF